MFNLWKACAQRLDVGLYNSVQLCSSSTEIAYPNSLPYDLCKLSPMFVLHQIHCFFIKLTDGFMNLYSQSTEPITTTTIYKGGRI